MAVLQRLHQAVGRLGALPTSVNAVSQVSQVLQSVENSQHSEPPCWVFLGPPGVGKGTYSGRIAEAMGVPHISAGDLVRSEIARQSDVGLKVMAHPMPVTHADVILRVSGPVAGALLHLISCLRCGHWLPE